MMEDVKYYAELLKEYDLTELTVEDGAQKISLKKEKVLTTTVPGGGAAPAGSGTGKATESDARDKAVDPDEEKFHAVKAPLLGMLHLAPSPDKMPFVKVGSRVKKGDTLCVIEAMKMMNDIAAPYDGVIEKICGEENEIVEYGQTLFLLS